MKPTVGMLVMVMPVAMLMVMAVRMVMPVPTTLYSLLTTLCPRINPHVFMGVVMLGVDRDAQTVQA